MDRTVKLASVVASYSISDQTLIIIDLLLMDAYYAKSQITSANILGKSLIQTWIYKMYNNNR